MDSMTFFYILNNDGTYSINGYNSNDLTQLHMIQGIDSFNQKPFATIEECKAWLINFYPYIKDLNDTSSITYDPSTIPITPSTPTGLVVAISTKIEAMKNDFNIASYETFTSKAFDGKTLETYACDTGSQAQIMAEASISALIKLGYSSEVISWHNINQAECVIWEPQNMIDLVSDLHAFMTKQTDYIEKLCVYINSLKDVDKVNSVTYGMEIPS